MKVIALLLFAAVAQSAVVPIPVTLARTPSLDSAIINSERLDGSFRYETVENHAYTPVVYQSIPAWNVIPQYPVVYSHVPSAPVYPFYNIIPQYPGSVAPGVPQTPIEVEDPADNASNDLKEESKDDDTVAVESA